MPTVDMTGVEDLKGFTPLPKGVYQVAIDEFSNEVGQKSGDDYVKLTLKVIDDGDEEESIAGRKLWRNLSLTPKSLPFLRQALFAFGCSPDEIAGQFDTDEILQDLVDMEATALAVVSVKKYKDPVTNETTVQNDVKSFRALSGVSA